MPIAKVTKGSDAGGCLGYVLGKKGAELLHSNCEGTNPQVIVCEFELAMQRHKRNGNSRHTQLNVYHTSIGFSLDCDLSSTDKVAIAHRYMELTGFDKHKHPHVIAEHSDTRHQHIHVVKSRVGWDGKTLNNTGWDYAKVEAAMRQIEVEFNLPQVTNSRAVEVKAPTVGEIRKSRKSGKPIPRCIIQEAIEAVLPQCTSLKDLEFQLLQQHSITLKVKLSQDLGQCLLFTHEDKTFSASTLGKRYTATSLENHFGIIQQPNEGRSQWQQWVDHLSEDEGEDSPRSKYKKLWSELSEALSKSKSTEPIEYQVALYAKLKGFEPAEVMKILSQSPRVQKIFRKKGKAAVAQKLEKVVEMAQVQLQKNLYQPRPGKRGVQR